MKHFAILILFLNCICRTLAQQDTGERQYISENLDFGMTLNVAGQLGYSIYIGKFVPVLYADYEFNVAKNITIAPSAECYSYHNHSYWGDAGNPYKNYNYREIVIPVGLKGTYYLSNLLHTVPGGMSIWQLRWNT